MWFVFLLGLIILLSVGKEDSSGAAYSSSVNLGFLIFIIPAIAKVDFGLKEIESQIIVKNDRREK